VPLPLQIVRQIEEAIEAGRLSRGTRLPSTRALARGLGVSRNTVLTAYEELAARGFIQGRRGAAMYVLGPAAVSGFDLRAVMREAQYPSCTIALRDQDGNPLYVSDQSTQDFLRTLRTATDPCGLFLAKGSRRIEASGARGRNRGGNDARGDDDEQTDGVGDRIEDVNDLADGGGGWRGQQQGGQSRG
jgi:DNA-binding transcriptional MocR family regulator